MHIHVKIVANIFTCLLDFSLVEQACLSKISLLDLFFTG